MSIKTASLNLKKLYSLQGGILSGVEFLADVDIRDETGKIIGSFQLDFKGKIGNEDNNGSYIKDFEIKANHE